MVRVPRTTTRSPSLRTSREVKVIFGYLATSKKSADRRCSSRAWMAVLMDLASMSIWTFAAVRGGGIALDVGLVPGKAARHIEEQRRGLEAQHGVIVVHAEYPGLGPEGQDQQQDWQKGSEEPWEPLGLGKGSESDDGAIAAKLSQETRHWGEIRHIQGGSGLCQGAGLGLDQQRGRGWRQLHQSASPSGFRNARRWTGRASGMGATTLARWTAWV